MVASGCRQPPTVYLASSLPPNYLRLRRHTPMVKQLDRDQELESQQAEAAGQQPAVQELRPSDGLPTYQLPGDGLSMGARMGRSPVEGPGATATDSAQYRGARLPHRAPV